MHRVRNAGISVTLYVMVGFPTKTRAEAEETLRTIVAHRDLIQEVSVRVFYLDESSEIYKRRAEFDIVEVFPGRPDRRSGLRAPRRRDGRGSARATTGERALTDAGSEGRVRAVSRVQGPRYVELARMAHGSHRRRTDAHR